MNRAQLAKKVTAAFDRAGDVIHSGVLERPAGTYDPETSSSAAAPTTLACRSLFDELKSVKDWATNLEFSPESEAIYMECRDGVPAKGDVLKIAGMANFTVVFVKDVVKAGALYFVVTA